MLLFKNTNRKMFRLIASLFVFVAFTLGGVGITRANAACTESQIDVNGDGTLCETAKFTLTTTNYTSVGGTFTFQISAAGTFYVDCGDGGTLSGTGVTGNTIDRTNNTNEDIYTCTYSTTGTKTIRFGGLATNYSTGTTTAAIQFGNFTGNTVSKIASISGSLSAMFPYITQNASDGAQPRFSYTFYGATNLTSIPDTLFSGYTTGAQTMFYYTFGGCTGLTSIPATLFSSFTTGASNMFFSTFGGCTGLTSIPATLFSSFTSGAFGMFSGTFWNCSNITGYIPPSTFAGLIANGAPKYNNMWGSTFAGTQLVETCPTGTVQYITGYEGTDTTNKTLWNGKVSCVSTTPMAITLDTTGATTAATPSTVYLSYDTGWYSDANGTAAITGLTTLPTKSGKLFGGFYTGENGTGTQVVDANGNIVSGNLKFTVQPTTLFATWVESKFTLTTTNYTSVGGTFKFQLSAAGTFYVDCGDGGTLSGTGVTGNTIDRTSSTNEDIYTCTYSTTGAKTIRFGGLATDYNTKTNTGAIQFGNFFDGTQSTQTMIASISGSLSAMFPYITQNASDGAQPRFYYTFYGATNLTSIPDTLFSGYTTAANFMFNFTFGGCTGLTSIPATLFSSFTTGASYMFQGTFWGCTGLTSIPATLFSSFTTGAQGMFNFTFNGCTGLTSIPATLFSSFTTGAQDMFRGTFSGCTGLTSIPATLFSSFTTAAQNMFNSTFSDCTGLTSIPATLFSSFTTGADYMFAYTFNGCTGLTSIPATLFGSFTSGAFGMFTNTFNNCSNITGYIPPTTFAGLIANGAPKLNMWRYTFTGTQLVETCPAGTVQYITGYEGTDTTNYQLWNGKVSCVSTTPMAITLDTTGATTTATPSTVYLSYDTGWYSDANRTAAITGLTTLPTKSGKVFGGFYTGENGTGTQIIDANGNIVSGNLKFTVQPTTLFAKWVDAYTVTYSCGDGTGTPPASDVVVAGLSFTPAANTCSRDGYLFAGWAVPGTNDVVDKEFTWNYNEDKTLTATWVESKFTLTTTNYTSVGGTFIFQLSAAGTFYVDCGDGGTLSGTGVTGNTIDRTSNTNNDTYTCTYSTTGTKTIRFGGLATDYNTDQYNTAAIRFGNFIGSTQTRIASISGSLSAMFPYITKNASDGAQPRFNFTFDGATNLTSIPDTLFSGYTTAANFMFNNTFSGCTGLTSIPATLFSSFTTGENYMFNYTFQGCTGLTSIPATLFSSFTTGASSMFYSTFRNCTGLTSIPATLFSSFTTGAIYMFYNTFNGCSNITGYIPPTTFAGLIANGAPKYGQMWRDTFTGTQLVETCPAGTAQYITGYEGTDTTNYQLWNGKVSCVSTTPMAITLDTTGATTAATPSTVYLSYDTGWYSDANGTAAITGLTTLPTKTNTKFGGFYTGENGTGTQVIDANGNIVSGNLKFTVQPTTIYAYFSSKFDVTYSCGDGVGNPKDDSADFGKEFVPADGGKECSRAGYDFAGWAVSGTNDVVSDKFTWNYGEDKTLTATWTVQSATCNGGQYYGSDGKCTQCPKNSYCVGGTFTYNGTDQGITACDVSYPNSDPGAADATACYRDCVVADITNATSVSGAMYYDGNNTCEPKSCNTGYYVVQAINPVDLNNVIGKISGSYNAKNNEFSITYQNKSGSNLYGASRCSASAGTEWWVYDDKEGKSEYVYNAGNFVNNLADETGQNGADYCYCNLNLYGSSSGSSQSLTTPWVYLGYLKPENGNGDGCASSCAAQCGVYLSETGVDASLAYRESVFNSVDATPIPAHCSNVYKITYDKLDDGSNYSGAPGTYEYGVGATIDGVPTRTGYTFGGWCTDEKLSNCAASQTISTSEYGDKTFYAKWTPNIYTVTLDTSNGDTAASPTPLYVKYNTGWYSDASATTEITQLATLPTKSGEFFGGFYTGVGGTGYMVIDANGKLDSKSTTFTNQSTTLYARFMALYNVTYSCGDGTGKAPAATTVFSGNTFEPAHDGECSRTGYDFGGWAVSNTNDVVSDKFTWNYTEDKTLTATWTAQSATCSGGQYYGSDGKCTQCPKNSYCVGGTFTYNGTDQGITACDVSYPNSNAGSSMATQCYRDCVMADVNIPHATAVSGEMFYDGTNTCSVVSCDTGYWVKQGATPVDLNNIVGTMWGNTSSNNNIFTNTYSTEKQDLIGTLDGIGICSTRAGTNWAYYDGKKYNYVYDAGNFVDNLTDETGESGANYCWCQLSTWTDNKDKVENLTTPAVFLQNQGKACNSSTCASLCGALTAYPDDTGLLYRDAIFDAIKGEPTTCSGEYGIIYNLNGGSNYNGAPESYTYGTGATISGTPNRNGYTFAGWCTDDKLNNCAASQTISVSEYGDKTFYAKWTANVYTITLVAPNADTGVSPTKVYLKYNTGWYSDANATTEITQLATLPTKSGENFAGFYTDENGKGTQIIYANGNFIRTDFDNSKLYAFFTTDYAVTYSCGLGTYDGEALNESKFIKYGDTFEPESGKEVCSRTGYYFAGWAVSGTNDVVEKEFTWKYTENKTLTATWTVQSATCSGGQYYGSDGKCTQCPKNSYCVGGTFTYNGTDQGITACDVSYPNSNVGSSMATQCYRDCVAADVPNAATVSGNIYYGGDNTCEPLTCGTGYWLKPGAAVSVSANLDSIIGTSSAYPTNTDGNNFNVVYGKNEEDQLGTLKGSGLCSTHAGYEWWDDKEGKYIYNANNFVDNLTDESGQSGAHYCWCNLSEWTPTGVSTQSVSTPWVFVRDYGKTCSSGTCTYNTCLNYMYSSEAQRLAYRNAILGAAVQSGTPGTPSCSGEYTITYNLNGGENYKGAPESYTYGTGATISGTPIKDGYTFAGWCTDDKLNNCAASQTISTSEYGDKTFYAKWTANVYTITLDASNADTAASPTPLYVKYDTGWYSDANATTPITQLTTLPTKSGQNFDGFYTGVGGTGNQVIDANGKMGSTTFTNQSTTLYARFKYRVTYSCGDGTGTPPPSKLVAYEEDFYIEPESGKVCSRTGYDFAGWAVSGTNEIWQDGNTYVWNYTENKTLTAVWEAEEYNCIIGTYLRASDGTCAFCPANSYCVGGTFKYNGTDQGITACSTLENGAYPYSAASAGSADQCYRSCVAADVPNATNVSGNNYYGDGADTCEPTTCDTGYHVESGTVSASVDLTKDFGSTSGVFNITNNEFSITYKDKSGSNNYLYGASRCSTSAGTEWWDDKEGKYIYDANNFVNNLADETGQNGADYCYCNLSRFTSSNDETLNMTTPWVYLVYLEPEKGNSDFCASYCATFCGWVLSETEEAETLAYRESVFNSVQWESTSATCSNKYDISYELNGGENYQNAPVDYTYGTGATINGVPTRTGYTFGGWCTDKNLENCAMTQTISSSADTDVTFYAKWTANIYTITLDTSNGDTAASPTPLYVRYDDGWYTDANATNSINQLNVLPTKTDWFFGGFYTGVGGTGNQVIDANGKMGSTTFTNQSTTLYAQFFKVYTVTYSCGDGVGNPKADTAKTDTSYEPLDGNKECSRTGYVFAGWAVSNTNDVVSDKFTWNYDEDKTLTATWTGVSPSCKEGEYLRASDAQCASCPANSYCVGGTFTYNGTDQGITACDVSYPNSNARSSMATQCYRDCVATDVTGATTVSGTMYYGGENTCSALTCDTGYHVESGTVSASVDLKKDFGSINGGYNYDVENNEFNITYQDESGKNYLYGASRCSASAGTEWWDDKEGKYIYDANNFVNNLADETGQNGADYCYCNLSRFTSSNDETLNMTTPWVYLKYFESTKNGNGDNCAIYCAERCGAYLAKTGDDKLAYRESVFNSVQWESTSATCSNKYNISYELNGGENYKGAPESYTYGTGATIDGVPTRTGYTFGGWCTDKNLENCAMTQTISSSADTDVTFYAKWTANIYTITLDASNADTGVSPTQLYVRYDDGWYTDANATNSINQLNVLPTKTDWFFMGFYTGSNVTGKKVISDYGKLPAKPNFTDQSTTLYAAFGTTSTVTYSCGDGTGTPPESDTVTTGQDFTPAYNGKTCSRDNYNFAGWAVSGTNDVVSDKFTWNYTEDKTLTAVWEGVSVKCNAGSYYSVTNGKCIDCPNNSYCTGGDFIYNGTDQGITACSTLENGAYPNSEYGATSENSCYALCTVAGANIAHATGVSGNIYYGGNNTCEPSTCDTGYWVKPESGVDLQSFIKDSDTGDYISHTMDDFSVQYYNGTQIRGEARLSTQGGTNWWDDKNQEYIYSAGNFVDNLVENNKGSNCWCKLTGFRSTSADAYEEISTPWVFLGNNYNSGKTEDCSSACSYYVGNGSGDYLAYRNAIFNTVEKTPAMCSGEYTITYNLNGGENYNGAPESYTYGTGATISGTPIKDGYTFAGWCTDKNLENCAMTQTISTSEYGNKTFYAKWTANVYTVTLDTSNADTGVVPATLYWKYNDGWYSDANATTKIKQLTTLPTKANSVFGGFWTSLGDKGEMIIDTSGSFVKQYPGQDITNSMVLYAKFGASYTVTYSCGDGTGTAPANGTAGYGVYFTPAANTCTPALGYQFDSWAVSGTNDVVEKEFTWNYTENKTLTAIWTLDTRKCEPGQYYRASDAQCVTCSANSYCPGKQEFTYNGSDQGITACSSLSKGEYPYSVAGSSSENQCYHACTTTDVEHSATVTGNSYYGAGNTCAPTTCTTGYWVKPGKEGVDFDTVLADATRADVSESSDAFTLSYIDDKKNTIGDLDGLSRCSTRAGYEWWDKNKKEYIYNAGNFVDNLTDETGNDGAQYCYCRLDSWTPAKGAKQDATTPWAFVWDAGKPDGCKDSCAKECYNKFDLSGDQQRAFSSAVFDTVASQPDTCSGEYNITYVMNGGENYKGAPETFDFGKGVTIDGVPLKTGYTFGGWCTDEQMSSCSSSLVVPSSSYGNQMLYANWTPQVFEISLDSANGDTASNPTKAYLAYETGWYSDSNMETPLTTLTTLPTKSGQLFGGFYTAQGGKGIQVIAPNGRMVTGEEALGAFLSDGTVYANYIYSGFSVEVASDLVAGGEVKFMMSAQGTFDVDCGADGVLSSDANDVSGTTITRANTSPATYTCTYSTGGGKTITFGGLATGYSTSESDSAITFSYQTDYTLSTEILTPSKIVSVSGIMSSVFPYISANAENGAQPRFVNTFRRTRIPSVPGTLFGGYTNASTHMFEGTFNGCYMLTSVPAELFGGISTGAGYAFYSTFHGSGLTSVPAGLFGGITAGAEHMFRLTFGTISSLTTISAGLFNHITTSAPRLFDNTFTGCSNLASVPAGLFDGITTGAEYMFSGTFANCYSLTSLPNGLFSNITVGAQSMFSSTFTGCRGLTSIPGDLFSSITEGASNMFGSTFRGCTGLTSLPDGLFSNVTTGASALFSNTFYGCTGLTSIPDGFFSSVMNNDLSMNNAMFMQTFEGCTGITRIPERLFIGITKQETQLFDRTFQGCTNLSSYIPPSTFAGLVANGSPVANIMWNNTFNNTQLDETCPSGTIQYITGYEGNTNGTSWNGKVSCISATPMAITLDSTGANTNADPSTVYLVYNTGWYSDAAGANELSSLTTVPTKTGKVFEGFYTRQNAAGTQIVEYDGDMLPNLTFTYEPTTAYANFVDAYDVTYSCGDGTGTPPTNEVAGYSLPFTPAQNTCTRTGYSFEGWAVSDTNDVVEDTFTWNYTENKTLTAVWEGIGVTCAAGSYYSVSTMACATCPAGWYCPGGTYVYNGSDQGLTVCPTNTYSTGGAAQCTACLENYTTDGLNQQTSAASCHITCLGGYYLKDPNDTECTPVGAGNYAAGAIVSQGNTSTYGSCVVGETTIGYGTGADESDDCGRIFHMGASHLYLRSARKTTNSLNVKIGDKIYYGNMVATDTVMSDGVNQSLRVNIGGTVYSVFDDSIVVSSVNPDPGNGQIVEPGVPSPGDNPIPEL